ncbi:MAG: TadE/TadG family type IV pilus assembly protein [Phenylobacterium sp.]
MLRRLGIDQRGVAAIEFALIAPVAIALYMGFAELTMAMMADRRVAHAASVVGDLVAQSPSVAPSDLTDIFQVGSQIMSPFTATPLKMRITSVVADANGVPKVAWSKGSGMTAMTVGTAAGGVPANLLQAGDSVIQADVSYSYVSPLGFTLTAPIAFSNTFFLKPRQSGSVACALC